MPKPSNSNSIIWPLRYFLGWDGHKDSRMAANKRLLLHLAAVLCTISDLDAGVCGFARAVAVCAPSAGLI